MKRALTATLGLGVLAIAWLGPLSSFAPGPFAAHMMMHMGVVAIAAPLLAWSARWKKGTGYFSSGKSSLSPFSSALAAAVVEFFAVWAWHAPALHHLARHTTSGLVLEQGTFLVTGLWVWIAAFGGDAREGGTRAGVGMVALLLTSMHMTLLGALLALSPRPLYPHHAGALSPLEDQHLGGAIMLLIGGSAYLVGGLVLAGALLRGRASAEEAR